MDLGQVGKVLDVVGIKILDQKGELREIGTVLEEIGNKWDQLSKAQQNALAIVLAGKRQYNNLLALFDNWDMYLNLVDVSANSLGTLQEQHEIYLESITAYEHKLTAELQSLYSNVIDEDAIINVTKTLTKLVEILNKVIDGLGGIHQIMPLILMAMTSAFSPKLANGLYNTIGKISNQFKDLKQRAIEVRNSLSGISPEMTLERELQARRVNSRQENLQNYESGNISLQEYQRRNALIEQSLERERTLANLQREERSLIQAANDQQRQMLQTHDREIVSLQAKLRYYQEIKAAAQQQAQNDLSNIVNNNNPAFRENLQKINATLNEQVPGSALRMQENERYMQNFVNLLDQQRELGNENLDILREQVNEWGRQSGASEEVIGDLNDILDSSSDIEEVRRRINETSRDNLQNINSIREELIDEVNHNTRLNDTEREILINRINSVFQLNEANAAERNILRQLQQQRQERERMLRQLQQQQRIQMAIQIGMASAMAFSEITRAMETFANAEATAEDKANSLFHGILNSINMIAFAINPVAGIISTVVTSVFSFVIKSTGLFDNLVESLKSSKEKVKELTDEIHSLNDEISSLDEELSKVNEQLERYVELKTKAASGSLTAEEREELDILSQQTANLEKQKELLELKKEIAQRNAEIALDEALNQQYKFDNVTLLGQDQTQHQTVNFEGNIKEVAQQVIEARRTILGFEQEALETINSGVEFSQLPIRLQGIVRAYKNSLDEVSQDILDEWMSGVVSLGESPELRTLLANLDPGKFGYFAEARKNLDEISEQINVGLEQTTEAAKILDENGPIYAEMLSVSTSFAKSMLQQAEIVSNISKESLKNLRYGLDGLKNIVGEEDVSSLKELSYAYDALSSGAMEATEVIQYLRDAGWEIDDSIANLEDNILSLSASFSNDLYQSLAKGVAEGRISIETFEELTGVIERLTDVAGTSEISFNTSNLDEIYTKLIEAESATERRIAGQGLQGWDAVANGTLENQLAFVREYYKQQESIEKVSQYQSLQRQKAYLEQLFLEANEIKARHDEAWTQGNVELAQSLEQPYEELLEKIRQTTQEAQDAYIDFVDATTVTFQDYQNAIDSIYNGGNLLSADEAWTFLKDLPNYEEYFNKGSYEILWSLMEDQQKVNATINEQIREYQRGIDVLLDKKESLQNSTFDLGLNDEQIADIDAQIEDLQERIEEKELELHINVDWKQTAKNLQMIGNTIDDLYNMLHEKEDTGPLFRIDNDEINKIANIYPELLAQHAQFIDGVMYLDRLGVDNFIQGEQDKLKASALEKQQEIDNQIAVIDAEIAMLEAKKAQNAATIADIAHAHQIATQYELGLEGDKQLAYGDTLDTAGQVAADISTNFVNAGASMASSIASGVSSSLTSLNTLGMEARKVAQQIANLDKPIFGGIRTSVSSSYKRQSNFVQTNNLNTSKMTKTSVEPLSGINDILASTKATTAQVDFAIAELNRAKGRLIAAKALIGNSFSGIGQLNKLKSGGGGGKGKKGGSEKELDAIEYEEDLYHYINQELERQEGLLKKVKSRKDTLYGKKYLEALEEEQSLLKSINELNKIKLGMQEEDLVAQKQNLIDKYQVEFDENGLILNYNKILAQKAEEVNKLADSKDEDAYKKAKEEYEEMEEAIDSYLDVLEDSYDLGQEIIDQQIEIMENNLDAIIKTIEFDLQPTEDTINYLDFLNSFYENDFNQSGENLIRLNEKYLETANSLDIYREGIDKLQESFKNGEITAADFNEEVREQRDALQEALLTLSEIEEEMRNAYKDALDEAEDQLSDYTETLEHYNNEMGHFIKIIELIGEGHEYGTISDIYGSQSENYMEQLRVQKKWYDNLLEQKKLLQETGQEGTDAWMEVNNAIEEVEDSIYSLAENALEALKDSYTNLIDDVVNKLDKSLTNGSKIQNMLTQYERDRDLGDMFLDKPTQLYEIDSLQKEIAKSMEEITDDLQKKQLAGLYDELDVMREKDKISEYDIERMKARFELLQAQAAFEDAQNAKNTMRLTRTSQGTWEYTFTADKQEVEEATNEVNEAYNNLYQMSKEHMQNLEQQILDTVSSYEEELKQLYKDWADGKFESEDEFYRQRDALVKYYEQKITDLTTQYNQARTDNAQDAEDLILNTSKETGEELIKQIEENKDQFNEAVADMADKIGGNGDDSFKSISNNTLDELDKAWNNYNDNISDITNEVNINLDDMQNKTKELEYQARDLADMIRYNVVPALQSEIEEVIRATAAHREEAAALREKIQAYLEYLRILNQTINTPEEKKDFDMDTDWAREALLAAAEGDRTAMDQAIANRLHKLEQLGEQYNKQEEVANFEKYFQAIQQGNKDLVEAIKRLYGSGIGYTSETAKELEKYLPKYDTGGYTGKGGFAVLHEKELVLNQDDTKNMLDLVAITRNLINSTLSYNRNPIEFSIPNIGSSFSNNSNHTQEVYIEASFPNANDKNEIEAALINIINDASQYVNRKR